MGALSNWLMLIAGRNSGARFNRKRTDLLALQEELTNEIAERLRLQLTGEENKKLRKRPAQNNKAFRLALEARNDVQDVSGGR